MALYDIQLFSFMNSTSNSLQNKNTLNETNLEPKSGVY